MRVHCLVRTFLKRWLKRKNRLRNDSREKIGIKITVPCTASSVEACMQLIKVAKKNAD